jgi:hypothetical protein
MQGGERAPFRGCPFHNAAVEAAGTIPEVAGLVARHKDSFERQLVETAKLAGAADPQDLGSQLAIVLEGASALATSNDDAHDASEARTLAELLIAMALPPESASVRSGA